MWGRKHAYFTGKEAEVQRSKVIFSELLLQALDLTLTPCAIFSLNPVLWRLQREWLRHMPKQHDTGQNAIWAMRVVLLVPEQWNDLPQTKRRVTSPASLRIPILQVFFRFRLFFCFVLFCFLAQLCKPPCLSTHHTPCPDNLYSAYWGLWPLSRRKAKGHWGLVKRALESK